VVGLLIAGIGVTYNTTQAVHEAHQNKTTIAAVAEARKESILTNCQDQNARNTKTIGFFNSYVAQYEKAHHLTDAQKRQLQVQVQGDVTLINDLAPHSNCQQLAQQEAP
jgi:hypothetical protein